jgi:hypothetical protein
MLIGLNVSESSGSFLGFSIGTTFVLNQLSKILHARTNYYCTGPEFLRIHHHPVRDTDCGQNLEQFSMQNLVAKNLGCDLSQSETEIRGASLTILFELNY